jgi:hypothetical protein
MIEYLRDIVIAHQTIHTVTIRRPQAKPVWESSWISYIHSDELFWRRRNEFAAVRSRIRLPHVLYVYRLLCDSRVLCAVVRPSESPCINNVAWGLCACGYSGVLRLQKVCFVYNWIKFGAYVTFGLLPHKSWRLIVQWIQGHPYLVNNSERSTRLRECVVRHWNVYVSYVRWKFILKNSEFGVFSRSFGESKTFGYLGPDRGYLKQCCVPVVITVWRALSVRKVSPLKPSVHLSSPPYMPHVPPISVF